MPKGDIKTVTLELASIQGELSRIVERAHSESNDLQLLAFGCHMTIADNTATSDPEQLKEAAVTLRASADAMLTRAATLRALAEQLGAWARVLDESSHGD